MPRSATIRNLSIAALAIVVAYQLGASHARAQSQTGIDAAYVCRPNGVTLSMMVLNRLLYLQEEDSTPFLVTPQPVPGTARVLACGEPNEVLLDNGEVWQFNGNGNNTWLRRAVFPVGPVPATRTTFGAIHAKYSH